MKDLRAGLTVVLVLCMAGGLFADDGGGPAVGARVRLTTGAATGTRRVIGDLLYIYPIVIALIGIPLYFPDGRLPSPRFQWVVWLIVAVPLVWTVEGLYHSGPVADGPSQDIVAAILGTLEIFILVGTLTGFGAAVAAVVTRFRRGDPVQRQQIKWLLAVVSLGALVWPASWMLDSTPAGNVLPTVGFTILFALPVVIAIAILRYRLYEIDRIVSRTIAYTAVTGILAVVFAAVILVLQGLLAWFTQGQTVAVAASTLAVAALFQPLRNRVKRLVDHRFDRARYDAERTAVAFAGRLRDEVDLETVTDDLGATVRAVLAPTGIGVWVRGGRP